MSFIPESVSISTKLFEGMRFLGVNYVQLVHWVEVDIDTGEIVEEVRTKTEDISRAVDLAHEVGLHVYLQLYPEYFSKSYWQKYGDLGPYVMHGGGIDKRTGVGWRGELSQGPVPDQASFLNEYTTVALKWAHYAEAHRVELFSPACEMNVFVSWSNNSQWHQESLPLLREAYHGDLVQKGEVTWAKYNLSPIGDLSFWDHYAGWDYVNADVFGDRVPLASYPEYVQQLIASLQALKAKHQAKGIILGEVGVPEQSDAWSNPYLSPGEIRLRFWNVLFQQSIEAIDGFFFWGCCDWDTLSLWSSPEGPLSSGEWQGPMSLMRLYYTATEEEQRTAYIEIHRLIWKLSEFQGTEVNLSELQNKLNAATTNYEQNRYDVAYWAATEGLNLANEIEPRIQAQVFISQAGEILHWLDTVGFSSLARADEARGKLTEAHQALEQGNAFEARTLAQQASYLTGLKVDDPQGDAVSDYGDLKTFYVTMDQDTLYTVIEVYGGAPTQDFAVDIDTTNGDQLVGLRAWCEQGRFFAVDSLADQVTVSGTCGPTALLLKASPLSPPFLVGARIEKPITEQQFEFIDEISPPRVRIDTD